MKNRKLFTVVVVLFLLIALSVPFAAGVFYDQQNGVVYADAYTYWDPDQPDTSIPYLDVWTTVININSVYDIDEVATSVDKSDGTYDLIINSGFWGYHKNIVFPVAAFEASQYDAHVSWISFINN